MKNFLGRDTAPKKLLSRAQFYRPWVELLEDRTLLSGILSGDRFKSVIDGINGQLTTYQNAMNTVLTTATAVIPVIGKSARDIFGTSDTKGTSNVNGVINAIHDKLTAVSKAITAGQNYPKLLVQQTIFNNMKDYLGENTGDVPAHVDVNDVVIPDATFDPANNNITIDIKLEKVINWPLGNLKFGLGLPGLPFEFKAGGPIQFGVTFGYHLIFGLQNGQPFVNNDAANEISIALNASYKAGESLEAQFGFLKLKSIDSPTNTLSLTGTLAMDLVGGFGAGNPIQSPPNLSVTANVHLPFETFTVGLIDDVFQLPKIQATLNVNWPILNTDPSANVKTFGQVPHVALDDVKIQFGGILKSLAGPLIKYLRFAMLPTQIFVGAVNFPIPGLSELWQTFFDEDATILGLANIVADLHVPIPEPFGVILKTVNILSGITNSFTALTDNAAFSSSLFDAYLPVGSIDFTAIAEGVQDLHDLRNLPKSLGEGGIEDFLKNSNLPLTTLAPLLQNAGHKLTDALESDAIPADVRNNQFYKDGLAAFKLKLKQLGSTIALNFPLVEDPVGSIFKLLMGQDFQFATFLINLPGQQFASNKELSLSRFAIDNVAPIKFGGDMTMDVYLKMGFDTRGIRGLLRDGPFGMFEGFNFDYRDPNSDPNHPTFKPLLTFDGKIEAKLGIGINVGLASGFAGVTGYVKADHVNISFDDPDNDGFFRPFTEINSFNSLFKTEGSVSAGLEASIYGEPFIGPRIYAFGPVHIAETPIINLNSGSDHNPDNPYPRLLAALKLNKPYVPHIAMRDAFVVEGNDGNTEATFKVTLDGPTTVPVTVGYRTTVGGSASATDFGAVSGTLVFEPGEYEKTITVPVVGDTVVEGDETFVVNLIAPSDGTPVNGLLADNFGLGTIYDDEFEVKPITSPRDATFDGDGVLVQVAPANMSGKGVAVDSNDRTIAVAELKSGGFAVARYNPNGQLDGTFGVSGIQSFAGNSGNGAGVAVYESGPNKDKILVAGNIKVPLKTGGPSGNILRRFNVDGSIDTTFGTDGDFGWNKSFLDIKIAICETGPNAGKIILANRDYMIRLNANGTPDGSFGKDPKNNPGLRIIVGSLAQGGIFNIQLGALAIDADGNILVAGQGVRPPIPNVSTSTFAMVVARLKDNGDLDNTFGSGGGAFFPYGGINQTLYALATDPDGNIVVAGEAGNILRFQPNGTNLDTTFGTGGKATYIFARDLVGPTTTPTFRSVAIAPDGKIVLAGDMLDSNSQYSVVVARLDNNGSLDYSFDPDHQGFLLIDQGGRADTTAAMAFTSDGKIVLAGTTVNATATVQDPKMLLARVDNNRQDLGIVVTSSSSGSVAADQDVTFYLGVTNKSTTTADKLNVTTQLPANTTFVSATGDFELSDTGRITWRINGLAANAGTQLTLIVKTTAQGPVFDVASVFGTLLDPNTNDNTSTNNVVAPGGLVHWWRGEGNAKDSGSPGLDGTLSASGTNFDYGKVGQAFNFDGRTTIQADGSKTGSQVSVGTQNLGSNYSLEMWIYPTMAINTDVKQHLVSNVSNDTNSLKFGSFYFTTDDKDSKGMGHLEYVQGIGGQRVRTIKDSVPVNVWSHVALTYDGDKTRLYINGALAGTSGPMGTAANGMPNAVFNNPLVFGWSVDGKSGSRFRGLMDEISLYNTVLSAADLAEVSREGSRGKGIGNHNPTLAADKATTTVDEGQTATNTGTFADPDLGDAVEVSASTGILTQDQAGHWSWSYSTTVGLASPANVTITANDGHGGSAVTTFALEVVPIDIGGGAGGGGGGGGGGDLDLTFGGGTGMAAANLPGSNGIGSSAFDPGNQNIVVAGYHANPDGTYDTAVSRFLPDGAVDTSFGDFASGTGGPRTGSKILHVGADSTSFDSSLGFAAAVQIDAISHAHKILVVGVIGIQPSLMRLKSDGSLDTTFDQDGILTLDYGFGQVAAYTTCVAVQADNKILAGGYFLTYGGNHGFLARFESDGTPDESFGQNGVMLEAFQNMLIGNLALAPDNTIIVGGPLYPVYEPAAARVTMAGVLDITFGTGGFAHTTNSFHDDVGMALDRSSGNGYRVVVGASLGSDGWVLARLDSTGQLDNSFGTDGIVEHITAYNYPRGLAVDSQHRVIGGGTAGQIIRFLEDGSQDLAFGPDPDHIIHAWPTRGILVDTQGRLVVGSTLNQGTILVTRYLSDQASPTVDKEAPASSVGALPAFTTDSTSFQVTWSGSDNPGGSGIASYQIWVSDDGAPATLWLQSPTAGSATYVGQNRHTYSFYSIATDHAGNEQPKPAVQATTFVKVLASGVSFADGILYVVGAAGQDNTIELVFTAKDGNIPAKLAVTVNGVPSTDVPALGTITQVQIFGQDGKDTIRVTNPLKLIFVNGGNGTDSLTINGADYATTFRLGTNSVDLGGFRLDLNGLENLVLKGQTGRQDFLYVDGVPSFPVLFDGGSTDANNPNLPPDTLVGLPDDANTFAITGLNAGTLNGSIAFTDVESLVGGGQADAFVFRDGKGVTGSLDGGGGIDTLDYSACTSGATVDLQTTKNTTGTKGGWINMEAAVGSSPTEDELVGPNKPNTWNITGTDAGTINAGAANAFSFSAFPYLTGGTGVDTFVFSDGKDVTGWIDGGTGADKLNYTAYRSAITVYLSTIPGTGTATGIGRFFAGIESINAGSTAADNLNVPGQGTISTINATNVEVTRNTYTGFENLFGGTGAKFVFAKDGQVSGIIHRGTLDYRAYAVAATVDLAASTATGTGGIANLEGMIFSSTKGTLIGANQANTWKINGSNSGTVTNGTGNSVTFSGVGINLVGGTDSDNFVFADGQQVNGKIDGKAGNDTLDYSKYTTFMNVNLQTMKAGLVSFLNMEKAIGGMGKIVNNKQTVYYTLTGANQDNVWNITGTDSGTANAGTVNAFSFSGYQNLTGGSATDSFVFDDAKNVTGAITGGTGADKLDYSAYTSAITVNLLTKPGTGFAGLASGTGSFAGLESFTGGSSTNDTLVGLDKANTWNIAGTNAGDVNITAAKAGDVGFKFAGVENLTGGNTFDIFAFADGAQVAGTIDGMGSVDTLDYTKYTTAITVNLATGAATGAGGIRRLESIIGGAGSDTLVGLNLSIGWAVTDANAGALKNGPFTFLSFTGVENLTGGTAADGFTLAAGKGLSGKIDGGGGRNFLGYTNYTTGVTIDLQAGTATNILGGVSNFQDVYGGSGADTLTGDAGDNLLMGNNGADILAGRAGNDTLSGGLGNNTIDGGPGVDTVQETDLITAILTDSSLRLRKDPAAQTYEVETLAGIEKGALWAGGDKGLTVLDAADFSGDVSLYGTSRTDFLKGGSGNDSLFGYGGPDTLIGGLGADYLDGGADIDRVVEGGLINARLSDTSLTTIRARPFGAVTDTLAGIEGATLYGLESAFGTFLSAQGFSGAATLYGTSRSDTLIGGEGNDTLIGHAGDDTLTGGAGVNDLDGGDGIDRVSEDWLISADLSDGALTTSRRDFSGQGLFGAAVSAKDTNHGIETATLAADALGGKLSAKSFRGDVIMIASGSPDTFTPGTGKLRILGLGLDDIVKGGVAFEYQLSGKIYQAYQDLGGADGFLGRPLMDQSATPDGTGQYVDFEHGSIYWRTGSIAAFEVHGAIRAKWYSLGGVQGRLGYPTSNEDWTDDGYRVNTFENGRILHSLSGKYEIVQFPEFSVTQSIVTSGLTALGGWVTVTVGQDGTVRFQGHIHDSGAEGYSFQIRAVVASVNSQFLVLQKSGTVLGTLSGFPPLGSDHPARDFNWDETTHSDAAAANYLEFKAVSGMLVYENHRGDFSVALGDLAGTALKALQWAVGTLVITPGVGLVIFAGVELGSLLTTQSLVPGARIIEGTLWLTGPYGTLYAMAASDIADANLVLAGTNTRSLRQEEYDWAQAIFLSTLPPIDDIVVTDTIGVGGRPFTFPRSDGKITLNFGPGAMAIDLRTYHAPFTDPSTGLERSYTDPRTGEKVVYGEILIHELTHAWQIAHTPDLAYIARALSSVNQYAYGPPGQPFSFFNLEQQASIVADWFKHGKNVHDPYFGYIAANIWAHNPI